MKQEPNEERDTSRDITRLWDAMTRLSAEVVRLKRMLSFASVLLWVVIAAMLTIISYAL